MAKYTIEIRRLVKNGFKFNLDDYPIFDENYRNTLNNLIINHFYFHEIGFETPSAFNFNLRRKMFEIMPRYNVLFHAQQTLLNDLYNNVDFTENYLKHGETNGNANSEAKSDSNNKSLLQDTPQGEISSTDIDNQKWATSLTLNKDSATSSGKTTTTDSTVEDYIRTIKGNNGGMYKIDVFDKIVNNFKNINEMILNDLNILFMGLL